MELEPPEGCDASVWRSLPRDIQRELLSSHPPSSASLASNSSSDITPSSPSSISSVPSNLGKRFPSCALKEKNPVLRSTRVCGSDNVTPAQDAERWYRLVQSQSVYEDFDFPPSIVSITGKKENEKDSRPDYVIGKTPECFCHAHAVKQTVKRHSNNQGREYFCCPTRQCSYFQWIDGSKDIPGQKFNPKHYTWTRFGSSLPLVTDVGYRSEDLLQGGVGDCWFMSALAVVASRHDLICRLFEVPLYDSFLSKTHLMDKRNETASQDDLAPVFSLSQSPTFRRTVVSEKQCVDVVQQTSNDAGAYAVRLFLDGMWRTVFIDDQLPVAMPDNARRRNIAEKFSNLAFCRCGSCATGEQLLWASLIEKAYAKAHGSYNAISGGEISEALLDLTGAPTLGIDFSSHTFNSEQLWSDLVRWHDEDLPMGCSTDPDPSLQDVGLFDMHAYSILDVREVFHRSLSPQHGHIPPKLLGGNENSVRLLKIRNPHGVGEWTGAFSNGSEELNNLISSNGEYALLPSGDNDGMFWIDYTHFLLGFSRVDLCFAYKGWCAHSFKNFFPKNLSVNQICDIAYVLSVERKSCVTISALQTSKRGAWCRQDIKNSYKYGDLGLILVRTVKSVAIGSSFDELAETEACSIVTGSLPAASREISIGSVLEPSHTYFVFVFSLFSLPSATASLPEKPFYLRLNAECPVEVTELKSSELPAGAPEKLLHMSFLHNFGHSVYRLQDPFEKDVAAFNRIISRQAHRLGDEVYSLILRSPSSTLVVLYNAGDCSTNPPTTINISVCARSARLRDKTGFLRSKSDAETIEYMNKMCRDLRGDAQNTVNGKSNGFPYPAKWSLYESSSTLAAGEACLGMVITGKGVQYQVGGLDIRISESHIEPATEDKSARLMESWVGSSMSNSTTRIARKSRSSLSNGLFAATIVPQDQMNGIAAEAVHDEIAGPNTNGMSLSREIHNEANTIYQGETFVDLTLDGVS